MSDEARERAAVEHHRSGAGIVEARDTVEERRLAGAVRPDQAANGAGLDFDEVFAASNRTASHDGSRNASARGVQGGRALSLLTLDDAISRAAVSPIRPAGRLGPPHELAGAGSRDCEGGENGAKALGLCPTPDPGSPEVAREPLHHMPPVSASLMLVAFPSCSRRFSLAAWDGELPADSSASPRPEFRRRSAGSGNGMTGDGRGGFSSP